MSQDSRKLDSRDAEVWVVQPPDAGARKPKRTKRLPESASQWLSIPEPSSDADDRAAKSLNGRSRRRWPFPGRLRRVEGELETHKKRNLDLELRVEKLEAKLRDERKRNRAKLADLRAQLKSDGRQIPRGKLDANTVTYEQLRALGLTVTQSANLIRHRDTQGGFRTNADLDGIPRLSDSARRAVKERLRVSRG